MKKKPDQLFPLLTQPGSTIFPTQLYDKKKQLRRPEPPSEETVLRLNAIVKQAPFCFHYQARENDFL
jgi:hypothetical protein